jgi:hypothetical protein
VTEPQGQGPQGPLSSGGWLGLFKGLTIHNAVAIMLLMVALVPAYVIYRLTTDPTLLDRMLSSYKLLDPKGSTCALRQARQRGEAYTWIITTGFAFEGGTRWAIGVSLPHEPSYEEMQSYCGTLGLLVDYMRNPSAVHMPVSPGTNAPIINQYKQPSQN